MPPKFCRRGEYRTNHGEECEVIKQRILTRVGKLKSYAQMLKELKSELKGMHTVYSSFPKEVNLQEIRNHVVTIKAMKKTYAHLINEQITDKLLYTEKYQEQYNGKN